MLTCTVDSGLSKQGKGDTVSLGWSNLTVPRGVDGEARWINQSSLAFNGNVSVQLSLRNNTNNTFPGGVAPHVGIAARGLYHQGYSLVGGQPYEGYLALSSEQPATVHVAFEDWGDDPTGNSGSTILASTTLEYQGAGEWTLHNFTLTPANSTRCVPYRFGKAPLDCSIPQSQQHAPASMTGDCAVCGGTFTVWLEDPGSTVRLDQVIRPSDLLSVYSHCALHTLR